MTKDALKCAIYRINAALSALERAAKEHGWEGKATAHMALTKAAVILNMPHDRTEISQHKPEAKAAEHRLIDNRFYPNDKFWEES
jgi:hypothetical protein